MSEAALERIQKEQREQTGKLDLTGLKLTAIPKGISGMAWLKELHLHDNQISRIEGLEGLESLSTLSLHSNHLSKIEGLEGLSSVSMLYLFNNKISRIEGLEGLTGLSVLYLSINKIHEIEGLVSLKDLSMLVIHSNPIRMLESLEGLSNVRVLQLHNSPIRKLEGLEELPGLKVLSFGHDEAETTFEASSLENIPVLNLKGLAIKDLGPFSSRILEGERVFWDSPRINMDKSESPAHVNFLLGGKKVHCRKGIYVKDCTGLAPALVAAVKEGPEALVQYLQKCKN